MTPYAVDCELELSPSAEGGLLEPMPAPTPSLLLIFSVAIENHGQDELQIGAMISGPAALVPGTVTGAQVTFWEDVGRVYATPGTEFRLWYSGRIVGSGRVLSELADETGDPP